MDAHTLVVDTLKASIVLSVLSIGMRASLGEAMSVLRRPALLGRSLLSMMIVMPAVAILFAKAFHLKSPIEIALLAISLSPLPPLIPKWARKPGTAEEYSIGLMVAAALASIVLIPLAMAMIGRIFSAQVSMPPQAIMPILIITILAPLALGILFHTLSPRIADRLANPVGMLGMILLLASFLPVLFAMHKALFSLFGNGTVLAMLAFSALGVLAGQWIGGPLPEHKTVLATFTASRHPAVAIAILHANFPGETLAAPAVILYLLICLLVTAAFAGRPKRIGTGAAGHMPERGGPQGLRPA